MSKTHIFLMTDFGLEDHYVGSIKAVIASISPDASILDMTHDIPPQDVEAAAFVLKTTYPYLPKHSIVVAVVDPGVGSTRKAICVKTQKGYLIGPNNGILSWALGHKQKYIVREIRNPKYMIHPVSSTFHARDIFSPTAAWITKGASFASVGPIMKYLIKLNYAKPRFQKRRVAGEIVYIDRFGNAITNIEKHHASKHIAQHVVVRARKLTTANMIRTFDAGQGGKLFALWNSANHLELAIKNASAEQKYELRKRQKVELLWKMN